jgi:Na+/proline symporter
MAFMPLVTTLFMVVVGWVGLAQFPGLSRNGSEQITMIMLKDISLRMPAMGALIVLFLSAAIAAIMSTVDSALLAISSLVTNDIYGRYKPEASQSVLTKMGKIASWVIMVVAVYMAIVLPQTIWRIMEIKLELLCQIAPSIFLGLHYKNLKGNAVFAGAAAGTIIALGIMLVNYLVPSFPVKPWGIHAGIWGLMVNVSILVFVHRGLCKT